MLRDVFYELAEQASRIKSSADGDAFLRTCIEKYELANIAYLAINIPVKRSGDDAYVTTTYSPDWHARYMSQHYLDIDPVVRRGLNRIVPLDWGSIDRGDRRLRQFFGEAREFGVGRHGLSFPIRGMHGEMALFSVNADGTDREWQEKKRLCMRDFQSIAFHYHEHVLRLEGIGVTEKPALSPRELDVLKWACEGKTDDEIADILGLAVRTVRFHFSNARLKLRAMNRMQAIATAIRSRLV